ncbi:ABC transporter permease [Pelistega europaea]|uniref:Iron export ABC transporter permease subunit FetB n=1 Tax=Pelistega europaea TaxID=106147 RepID=A0A7Y4LD97_9BURK|nr:iron export ABC transporter permease subunit FetB [Pelistega europaea]NOL50317.1 iron export ABC transporter permease subunit FetB [Pelistega europaea]
MDYHSLSYADIAIAASLILINGIISLIMRLGLVKSLLIGAIRTVVQLSVIGIVLKWIFTINHESVVLLILLVMTSIAAITAKGRNSFTYRGLLQDTFVAVWLPSWTVLFISMLLILRVDPWYSPQFLIPIGGMIIGNILTGVALVTERLLSEIKEKRAYIEMLISLGATPWESYQKIAKNAVSAGMMPSINNMMVVGLVSLPGMMTGQILAGQDPEQAVRYQIIMLFFQTATTGIACILVVYMVFKRLFNAEGILLFERLKASNKKHKR